VAAGCLELAGSDVAAWVAAGERVMVPLQLAEPAAGKQQLLPGGLGGQVRCLKTITLPHIPCSTQPQSAANESLIAGKQACSIQLGSRYRLWWASSSCCQEEWAGRCVLSGAQQACSSQPKRQETVVWQASSRRPGGLGAQVRCLVQSKCAAACLVAGDSSVAGKQQLLPGGAGQAGALGNCKGRVCCNWVGAAGTCVLRVRYVQQ
jgi:hypothetical protein